jgi:hypothetical protein
MPIQIGVYQALEKIGEGGMGQVYRGLDTMLEREVAIKQLRAELAGRSDVVGRFRTEAIALGKLNHPNIVTLYSFLRQDDAFYMVLEFVRGETLDAMIRRRGALPWQEAVTLTIQALRGLEHAHQMHVIHRDLKPANAILTPGGVLKLMDFGIARILDTARMTRVGHLIGTLEYMAPEQVQGGDGDARSDLYSLGIVLYELLAGRVPFERATDYELIKAQIEAPTPPLKTFGVVVPAAVEKVLARAVSKAPDKRFQSAGEFAGALQAVLDEAATPVRVDGQHSLASRARALPRAAWTLAKANPVVAAAVIMVLIGLGLASRGDKVPVVASSGGTATETRGTDKASPGGPASATGGSTGPAVTADAPGFTMPTGPLLPPATTGPARAPVEKPGASPPVAKAAPPVASKPVVPPPRDTATPPVTENPPAPPARDRNVEGGSEQNTRTVVEPKDRLESKAPPDPRPQPKAPSSEALAPSAGPSRSFAVPFDRVWTVSESALRSLGWDIDKRDRTGGSIVTGSRSLDKDNFGVYEKSLRQRLRLHIRATSTGHTVVTVERIVFKRQRVMWVNTDEPLELDPRAGQKTEHAVLAAIARSL